MHFPSLASLIAEAVSTQRHYMIEIYKRRNHMTSWHHMTSHDITWHHITWRRKRGRDSTFSPIPSWLSSSSKSAWTSSLPPLPPSSSRPFPVTRIWSFSRARGWRELKCEWQLRLRHRERYAILLFWLLRSYSELFRLLRSCPEVVKRRGRSVTYIAPLVSFFSNPEFSELLSESLHLQCQCLSIG